MLHPGNAGLKSIKILRIRFEARERETSDSDNSRAQTVVRMLVEFLPANILEDFEYNYTHPTLSFTPLANGLSDGHLGLPLIKKHS